MTPDEVLLILEAVRSGETSLDRAAERLLARNGAGDAGFVDLGIARVDTDRRRRRGFPEVIYCASKTPAQIAAIARTLMETEGLAYGTRCDADAARQVIEQLGGGDYDALSRTFRAGEPLPLFTEVRTAVIAAGTSDLPVAEEICRTLETFGAPFERVYDVGVAGLHRLLDRREQIESAGVLIVVAGMEGALPSVVGGLFRGPIIAVPTSVGYGTAMGGFTALFAMLTSCASGITVVNIDNGFGAAMAALTIVQAIEKGVSS